MQNQQMLSTTETTINEPSDAEQSAMVYWELSSYVRGRIQFKKNRGMHIGDCISLCTIEMEERRSTQLLFDRFKGLQDDLIMGKFS